MTLPLLRSAEPIQRVVSQPRCTRCENPNTELLTTMRLHTCDAHEWFRCEECDHIFSVSRAGEP